MDLKAWAKEPLVHFLAAGGALFLIAGAWNDAGDSNGRVIDVSREELLIYLQARAQVYDEDTFAALLDGMEGEERDRLIRDTALQEALYREGQSLNLTQADPLIRQRIVQQMRLLLAEESAANLTVSDDEIRAFYQGNRADYALSPSVSFSHVFYRGEGREAEAAQGLMTLRSEGVTSDNAGQYGERFLYQINYAEAGAPLLASHFGAQFTEQAFAAKLGEWSGPFPSEHGWHLVLLRDRNEGREPEYSAIETRVREDALAHKRQSAAGDAMDALLDKYEIRLNAEFAQ